MNDKRKLKLKKFYFHPITVFIFLTIVVILLSGILSAFQMQATYNTVNVNTKELEPTLIAVENLLSFNGLKFILSNALINFLKFTLHFSLYFNWDLILNFMCAKDLNLSFRWRVNCFRTIW